MTRPARGTTELRALTPDERRELCRRVMAELSDLVEGEADAEFCETVEAVLGRCQPYLALRNTFETTIELVRHIGSDRRALEALEEESFRHCVQRVRRRLESTVQHRDRDG